MICFRPLCGSSGGSSTAWKVSHSEAKPFSGGKAEIATQPTRKASAALMSEVMTKVAIYRRREQGCRRKPGRARWPNGRRRRR
jgi:hypothetical protein